MAKMTGGEALARTLKAAGVEYIFGISVGSQAPFTLAAMRLGMRIVTVRDEKCAALMATAYSKTSGKPGICLASGPGAAHLALGMYEAFNSANAIVTLTSDATVAGMWRPGSAYMDQQALFQPITKWTVRAEALAALPDIIRRALRVSTTGSPGPVAVIVANALFAAEGDFNIPTEAATAQPLAPRVVPGAESVAQAGGSRLVGWIASAYLATEEQQASTRLARENEFKCVQQQVEALADVEQTKEHDGGVVLFQSESGTKSVAVVVKRRTTAHIWANRNLMVARRWPARGVEVAGVGRDHRVAGTREKAHSDCSECAGHGKQIRHTGVVQGRHRAYPRTNAAQQRGHHTHVTQEVEGAGLELNVDDAPARGAFDEPAQRSGVPAVDVTAGEHVAVVVEVPERRTQVVGVVAHAADIWRILAADEQDHLRSRALRKPLPMTRRRARRSGTCEPMASLADSSPARARYSTIR